MNLRETVSKILGREVTEAEAIIFANDQFGVLAAYLKDKNKETKSGFDIVQVVEIPVENLSEAILNELSGRESFVDADEGLGEQIFLGDIFEQIACQQEEMPKNSPFKLSPEDIERVDELAKELKAYELIRITKI